MATAKSLGSSQIDSHPPKLRPGRSHTETLHRGGRRDTPKTQTVSAHIDAAETRRERERETHTHEIASRLVLPTTLLMLEHYSLAVTTSKLILQDDSTTDRLAVADR